jgi:hypothetical protein
MVLPRKGLLAIIVPSSHDTMDQHHSTWWLSMAVLAHLVSWRQWHVVSPRNEAFRAISDGDER